MKNLLIADDQPGIRLLLSEVFRQEGYNVHLAANGVEALQLVQAEQLDCILLDLEMPGKNGAEVLQKLLINWPDLPVIMMTAHAEEGLVDINPRDIVHLFTKPFDIHEVRDVINGLFEN